MNRLIKISLGISLLCSAFAEHGYSSWKKVRQFNDVVSCGYFFDADNGIIGLGEFFTGSSDHLGNQPLQIFWTSDGGITWTASKIPSGGRGRITSISMQNRLEGYAAVYSNQYSLWKTTDGGISWQDHTQNNFDLSTCVYATSKAIVKTIWGGNLGGRSIDGGRSYSNQFSGGNANQSNGVDFADDLNGVVTMGPTSVFNPSVAWFTTDGGVTWTPGDNLPESWGVIAIRDTKTFLALSEDASNTGHTVYWSQNGGRNWSSRFIFQGSPSFTGHIAGSGSTLYVQTDTKANLGLFRSDDLGASWISVGGPSNVRDTRFAVTGCRGEVVYAFDNLGGVWKTIDGGDGAFSFTPRIGTIKSIKAGDSTHIPIFLDSTSTQFSIDQISGSISLNTDLLTPDGFDTSRTLSQSVIFDTLYQAEDKSVHFLIKYSTPLTNGISFSTPLIYLKAYAYLTSQDTTTVTLNALDINSGSSQKPLAVCSSTSGFFALLPECGEPSIRDYMATGDLPKLISISPNPSSSHADIHIYLPSETNVKLDVFDDNGKTVIAEAFNGHYAQGDHILRLTTSTLSNGPHFLQLTTGGGRMITGNLVIQR